MKVLITGSGRRLGRHLAIGFAKKGWDVCVHYNESEEEAHRTIELISQFDNNYYLIKSDVRNREELEKSFQNCFDDFGVPNVLINNSGVFPPETSLENVTDEMWNSTQEINTRAAFYASRFYSSHAKEGDRIINIASLGGQEIWKERIPYNVSKAALLQLTMALARELGPKISVNSVSPGMIIIPDEPAEDGSKAPLDKIPMGRYGAPEDLFDAVYFFATCSHYITGQNLNVDGGYHVSR